MCGQKDYFEIHLTLRKTIDKIHVEMILLSFPLVPFSQQKLKYEEIPMLELPTNTNILTKFLLRNSKAENNSAVNQWPSLDSSKLLFQHLSQYQYHEIPDHVLLFIILERMTNLCILFLDSVILANLGRIG